MPTTTITTTRTTGVAVHTISFRGLAGAIFVCLSLSAILYVIGFATTGWSIKSAIHEGLWETCACNVNREKADWFIATQAMITIGLIGLIIAMILAAVYLCVHSISKNSTILTLVIVCFLATIFMVIGFIVYGANRDGLHWSFVCTVISCILCFVAGVLSIVQMKKAGVHI